MATTEKNITVDGTFKLKIGEIEIALTREEVEGLYGELFRVLGKTIPAFPISYPYPVYIKPIPNYEPDYYKVGAFPPYTVVTCKCT